MNKNLNLAFWDDKTVWKESSINTFWCLLGCAVGDFGTIYVFQHFPGLLTTLETMALATVNGLLTSIILETFILRFRQKVSWKQALITAWGMSFLSMVAMETAMNLVDYGLTGGAVIVWWVVPIALFVGFLTPWPYNYWRLKKWGKACH